MLGDPGSGVHDLEVTNVTLEDDGRFQCQVSPNRGQDAIRADAILTVLGKLKIFAIATFRTCYTRKATTKCSTNDPEQITLMVVPSRSIT